MAWKWNQVDNYTVSVGANAYHALVQMSGPDGFYASIHFRPGERPSGDAPQHHGNRFWGRLDYSQMQMFVDILRNEKPVRFGYDDQNNNNFHLMTGPEPVGEADGVLARAP